ncbi:MAG: hypothetical protein Kow0068_09830 [Marinilabiliales bacterium]
MKEKLLNSFEKIKNNENLRRKILIFLIFLLISSTFWLLNALTKDYITVLKVPLKYKNMPEGKVLVHELPTQAHILVKGNGFLLLQSKIFTFSNPVIFDINSLIKFSKDNFGNYKKYVLRSETLEDIITKQLKSELQLISVQPDTIAFEFSNMISKTLPVKPNIKISTAKQYIFSDEVRVEPDSIVVEGPKIIIDTLKYIETYPFEFNGLSESISRSLELNDLNVLKLSKKRVTIKIPVEKFTEQEIKLKINVLNVPDTIVMDIYPENVSLIYHVKLSDFNEIDDSDFLVAVDYFDTEKSVSRNVNVKLSRAPEKAFDITYSPKTVKYLLRNND